MAATASVPAVLDALRAALVARPGLAGVAVFTAPMGVETPPEAIVFAGADVTQEWRSLGSNRKTETVTGEGLQAAVWVARPGAGEPVIKASRDRAYEIFAELERQIREDPKLGGVLDGGLPLAVTGYRHEAGLADNARRWTQITVGITWQAQLAAV